MDKGVAGFRCDALKYLYEDLSLLDEPLLPGMENASQYISLNHIYTTNLPEVISTVLEWKAFINNYAKSKKLISR